MKTKFDVFLSQIDIARKKKLTSDILDNVYIDRESKTWEIFLSLPSLFTVSEITDLLEKITMFFKVDVVKKIIVKINYIDKSTKKVNMKEYWNFIISQMANEKARYLAFKDFEVKFSMNTYQVLVDCDSMHLSVYIDTITEKFLEYGLDIKIDLVACEDLKSISDQIKEKEVANTKKIVDEVAKAQNRPQEEEIKITKYKSSKTNESVCINEIPVDNTGLFEYQNTKAKPYFTIEGEIFNIESRLLPKSKEPTYLINFFITDNVDSILVQQFVRKPEEIKKLLALSIGDFIKARGEAIYDTYKRAVVLRADRIKVLDKIKKEIRIDNELSKRVELHTHTVMSNLDGVCKATDYIKQAILWGHKAIAFTDHNGVYAFPEIAKATNGEDIKPIYGVELPMVDMDDCKIAYTNHNFNLDSATYVVFDIETTGLSAEYDDLIEIAGIKYHNGTQIEKFSELINPNRKITEFITSKTGIDNEMVKNARSRDFVLKDFHKFSKDCVLVAHNASFDLDHIYANYKKMNIKFDEQPAVDTLQLARIIYADKMKRFDLGALTKFLKIKLVEHHRAEYDALATGEAWILMCQHIKGLGITKYEDINNLIGEEAWKTLYPKHISILVKNQTGLKNLYKLLSDSLTNHLHKGPRVLKSVLEKHSEGLLIGSSCVNGIVFETALNKEYKDLLQKIELYDYIEIQPPSVYNHIKVNASVDGDFLVKNTIKKIIKAANEKKKMVVATGDVHYLNKDDQKYRDIYLKTPVVGGGLHSLEKFPATNEQHFLTTQEMLKEFSFLDKDYANEIVVKNTNIIADMIDEVKIFPENLFAPSDDEFKDVLNVNSIEKEVKEMVDKNVHDRYGSKLPKILEERLNKELNSIINNKFSSIYYMSHLLVKKSLNEGYLVGSRGSVGSSFIANLMNITEVNPLSPHYLCKKCCFSSFKMTVEEKKKYGIRKEEEKLQVELNKVESGYDLPDAICPVCKNKLSKDGQDIPFETFLGFRGDKVPDIDLNFSGDYQSIAHEYVRTLMGVDHAFRAGTTSTVAERTAFGYVKGYLEKTRTICRDAEIARIAKKIQGVKRSTGQHPGGIVVVPKGIEIYDITPIQYPADDNKDGWRTTHFDYHSFESNLLKLDILGHDDPTVIKFLMDYVYTHKDEFPFDNPMDIPITDKDVLGLFSGTKSIGVTKEDINSDIASYAVPELGTNFVRQMLKDTKPKNFSELVKISGLSHGTNVWLNNAQNLVLGKNKDFGLIPFKNVIGCRDDIMVYLIYQGLEPEKAFEIMEFVRRGKPKSDLEKWAEYETYMRDKNVPAWYIWSCSKIEYMFPKAHATAYVLMALRIAWFKVHKPLLFYCAYFSKRASQFDVEVMCSSANGIYNKIKELEKTTKGFYGSKDSRASAKKTEDLITVLYVALEMTRRGFEFKMVDIEKSQAKDFVMEGKGLICPFITIDGLGLSAAESVITERNIKKFTSRNDISKRSKINKTVYEKMENYGVFENVLDDNKEVINDLFAYVDKM